MKKTVALLFALATSSFSATATLKGRVISIEISSITINSGNTVRTIDDVHFSIGGDGMPNSIGTFYIPKTDSAYAQFFSMLLTSQDDERSVEVQYDDTSISTQKRILVQRLWLRDRYNP